jgi:GWxTD domain-containing protein
MIVIENLVRTPLAKALGWTLFHSLWEGTAVALALLIIFFVIRPARARYVSACIALAVIGLGFVFTLFLVFPGESVVASTQIRVLPAVPSAGGGWITGVSERLRAEDMLPWLAPFWFAGVILFQLRSLGSWVAARRLRNRGVCPAPDRWQQRLAELCARIRLTRQVALLDSCLTTIPVVIGNLRPTILVPIGFLSGMPECQIEAILLHELAHVLRRDYLVNMIQTVVEGFLFYHPAVWWISSVIRSERENCCDDMVVAAGSEAKEYAVALTTLEQNRQTAHAAALAATGGSLMKRIRRLLDQSGKSRQLGLPGAPGPILSTGVMLLTAALAFMAWPVVSPPADAQVNQAHVNQAQVSQARVNQSQSSQAQTRPVQISQAQDPGQKVFPPIPAQTGQVQTSETQEPGQKWLSEDVTYIITDAERNAFRQLTTDDERAQFVEQFWLRRDPTPSTPENELKDEHYRRIGFANGRFTSQSGVPGWRTDRGRIYIEFGPPDEIDSHPATNDGQTPAHETWRYRWIEGIGNNVLMDFVDTKGNGEFSMTRDPAATTGVLAPHN